MSNMIHPRQRAAVFERSPGYVHFRNAGLCGTGLSPWELFAADDGLGLQQYLKTEHPQPRMVVFAHRGDRGEVACFDIKDTTDKVYLYEFTEAETPYTPYARYKSCFEWWRASLEDTIEGVLQFGEHLGRSDRISLELGVPNDEEANEGDCTTVNLADSTLSSWDSQVPQWLQVVSAPGAYRLLVEDGLLGVDFSPWKFLQGRDLLLASLELQLAHPQRKFVAFARHTKYRDLACWDSECTDNRIYTAHLVPGTEPELEISQHSNMFYWLRSVFDSFIAQKM